MLAADAFLRARDAAPYLPLRLRLERDGDRAVLTVTNATVVPQQVYTGKVQLPELARLLDETRRASLAGVRLKGTFANFIGEVRTLKQPVRIAAPLRVQGELALPGQAPVSFDRTLGDGQPLSFQVEARGQGVPKVHLQARPAAVVRELRPPGASTWAAALSRSAQPVEEVVHRLMTTRLQIVRADQFQSFLAEPGRGRPRPLRLRVRDGRGQATRGRRSRAPGRQRQRCAARRPGPDRVDRRRRRRARRLGAQLGGLPEPSAKSRRMADVPDMLVLKRDRDLEGRLNDIWVRRSLMALIAAVPVIALFNVFGQRPDSTTLVSPEASLKIYAPSHLRGGLIFQARFHVTAREDIKDAYIVLGPGWAEGMTINTIEPSPVSEASNNGRISLELGHIPAGQSYILFTDFQVNPTNVAFGRRQTVWLTDGKTRLITYEREINVYP